MRLLGRSNLVGCQVAPTDRMVILTWGVYTILVDIGISLRWLIAPADRTVILTCRVLLIPRFPEAMKVNVPEGLPIYES